MQRKFWLLVLVVLCVAPLATWCQEKSESASSVIPKHILQDEFLDKMVGNWRLGGKFEGQPVNHSVEIRWVLNHQFIEIHEKDLNPPKGGDVAYEAMVYIGYEPSHQRYVAHWLDVFGGGASILGYGRRTQSAIEFDFEYPGQPWLTTFRRDAAPKAWKWLMRTKNKQGQWVETANMTLTPAGQQ